MNGISEGMWNGLMGKLLYVPIFNLLVLLYVYIPGQDFGISIIVLTLIIRLILHPSYANSLKAQHDLQRIQPYIDKIRQEHKDDPQKQSQAIMEIYKEHKVSPLGSCLPLLIQLPIIFALYRVFIAGLDTSSLAHLYSWFPNPPTDLHLTFLGLIDLSQTSIWLAIVAGASQFLQGWISQKYNPARPNMNTQQLPFNPQMIMYIFPFVTIAIAITLPAALSLYWTASTLIMATEQLVIYRGFARQEIEVIKTTHHGDS